MAYHLTGAKAFVAAHSGKLTPVKSGLNRLTEKDLRIVDALHKTVVMPAGTEYTITGTADGNGYVVTITDGPTHYFTADDGCVLC